METGRLLVVGAAIVAGGQLLVAQRAAPPELAGYWEFPGGKVERGETPEEAVRRECREELGVDITTGDVLAPDVPILNGSAWLRVFVARISGGTLTPREHSALAWLDDSAVATLAWLPSNAPLVAAAQRLLRMERRDAVAASAARPPARDVPHPIGDRGAAREQLPDA